MVWRQFKWIAEGSLNKQPCKKDNLDVNVFAAPIPPPPTPRSQDAGKGMPTNHCFNAKQMLVPGMKQLKRINFLCF